MWPFGVSHLPFAGGPYIPGCVDVMTEYSKDGIFFRLYYPTDKKAHIKDYIQHWMPWLPDKSYIHGFARVVMIWVIIIRLVRWIFSGNMYIPVVNGAKIKKDEKLKCILLSHGLGGGRFLYSSTCIELASRGFLVAAIEHRDESSANTYYYKNKEDVINDQKTFMTYTPVNLGNNHYFVRNNQVLQRAEECKKLVNFLRNVNSGSAPYNILNDLPDSAHYEFRLEDMKELLDVDDLTILGHSFGAATSLVTLAKNKEIRRGVILDSWMFPIKDMPEILSEVTQPLVFINTQTFHILSNVKIMEKFVDAHPETRPVFTILHTTHESQTDTVFIFGYWLNWFMKKLSAGKAMKINNALILKFLSEQFSCATDNGDCKKYLLEETHNVVSGIPALESLLKL